MKKYLLYCYSLVILSFFSLQLTAQIKKMQSTSNLKTMTWTTKSPAAKELALKALTRLMNIEFPQAYEGFSAALKLDPDFTVVLAIMSNLSFGETKKKYAARALKSAANKTAGEKLFVTIVDEKSTDDSRRETWAKLYKMFPDGKMIGTNYVFTRATAEERFTAAEEFIKKFPDEPSMYNIIAYYYMNDKKDIDLAKKNFEKYIAMYPEGYNPYDSMGEFYLNTGDNANAEKYYTMALERYPFNTSSLNAIQKMKETKPKTQEAKPKMEGN